MAQISVVCTEPQCPDWGKIVTTYTEIGDVGVFIEEWIPGESLKDVCPTCCTTGDLDPDTIIE